MSNPVARLLASGPMQCLTVRPAEVPRSVRYPQACGAPLDPRQVEGFYHPRIVLLGSPTVVPVRRSALRMSCRAGCGCGTRVHVPSCRLVRTAVGALALRTAVVAGPALAAVTMALATAGCSAGSSAAVPSPSAAGPTRLSVPASSQSSSSDPSAAATTAVLRQYDAFWGALPPASAATTDTSRLDALFATTTTPELSQLVETFGKQRTAGKVLYGRDVLHPVVTSVANDLARVTDCQDSSQSGVMDLKSGRRLTVGVSRNPVDATLLMRGGVWKVSVVHYRPGDTC